MTDATDDVARLKAAASERWGEHWRIDVTHFADGTTRAQATTVHGRADPGDVDETVADDAVLLEREKIRFVDDGLLYRREIIHRDDVVDVLEEELDGDSDGGV